MAHAVCDVPAQEQRDEEALESVQREDIFGLLRGENSGKPLVRPG